MRKRYRLDEEEEPGIDLTPLMDVVFIMLIFFIVTTSFVKESGVEVNRPTAATAQRQERGTIVVAITADGRIWIDRREVDPRAVRASVARLRAASPAASVVIQADRDSRNGLLVRVMDQIRRAGVRNIAIAADTP